MKAIIVKETGGVEKLELTTIDKSKIKANEVLVKTRALGVNPVDFKVRSNNDLLTMIYGEKRPAILGWDIAGDVVEVGSEVKDFKPDDKVFGMVNFLGAGDAYAEFVAAPESHLARIPENIDYEAAAATTLAALTALQVLSDRVKTGDRILIHAGSGGVGHFAIQIAKSIGAYVTTTSSASNKDFVTGLGADQHIDYRSEAFEEVLDNIDFVFDMFNGDILHKSVQLVKEGGRVLSLPTPEFAEETQALADQKNVTLEFHMVSSNGKDMARLAQMLSEGILKPHISKVYTFEDIPHAHLQLESGRTKGKLVIKM